MGNHTGLYRDTRFDLKCFSFCIPNQWQIVAHKRFVWQKMLFFEGTTIMNVKKIGILGYWAIFVVVISN